MRDIKFRAWNKNTYEMVEVMTIDFEKEEVCWIYDDYAHWEQSREWVGFEDIELMQFTGEKDKNDVDIYEEDILYILQTGVISNSFEAHDENRKVLFYEGSFCIENYANYENVDIENHYEIGLYHTADELEVIGNIYENPELMV